ncbi:MAG: replicative DNA helicase [Microthrixaceae bacterium]
MAASANPGDVSRLRVPPHSIEAEESLLGAMLLSEQAISAVTNVVTSDDFYRPAHRHIFDAIQALYGAGQGVDPVTVADELGQADVLDAVGGSGTLITLQARTPAITNALHYAKIVEEKALLRKLIMTANDVAELGYSPLDDIEKTIDSAESMMFAVAQRRNTDSLSALAPLLDASLEQLEKLAERGDAVTGTPTGYVDLDVQLAGLQPGALIVVGARPAMGKTAFALGLAAHAAVREQRPVLFFSLEMSHLELTQRLIASEARIDATKLRTGRLTDSDWTKISKAMGRLGEGQLWIDDNPALTVTEIRSKARRLQDRLDQPLGLIVVDYLQLMSGRGSAESRQVEVSEISRGLKILARELEVPVMALSQLSRQLEQRADKRPMLADLRESGCLVAETRVLRADTNTEVTLGELLESGETNVPVWSLNDEYKLVPARMTHAFPSGTKDAFRLRLSSGREVTATANHPFKTVQGWRRLDELSVGSRIASPRRIGAPEKLCAVPAETLHSLAEASRRGGSVLPAVFSLADEQLGQVLAKLFGSIGSLGLGELRGRPLVRLTATSTSRQLIDDIQLLLLRFGILSRITNIGPNKPRWRLWIHGADHQRRFLAQIGVAGDRGECVSAAIEALREVRSNPNVDTIPAEVRHQVVKELRAADMTLRQLADALGEQYCGGYLLGTETRPRCSSRERLEKIAQATDSKSLVALAESDVFWDEVVEVTALGPQPVYDATVLGTHNFVANSVIVHNSIEQDADVVMFLYRDEVYNADSGDKDTAEVIVSKHRSGPTGTTRLVFLDYCTLFTNMARES